MSIFLVGMMGSGKSSVGIKLSEILQKEFVDLDNKVERDFGRKIADIFREFGEEKFRYLESSALEELCNCPKYHCCNGWWSTSKKAKCFFADA